MPTRPTKRGAARTRLERDCDVLVCGASFAGLAVARELRGSGARVLLIDRYELGERQTSACAMPTVWMQALGVTWTYLRQYRSVDDDLQAFEAVTLDDIRRVTERYPLDRHSVLALGPLDKLDGNGSAKQ